MYPTATPRQGERPAYRTIRLPQDTTVSPKRHRTPVADVLFTYQRSNDSQAHGMVGQDYLTYRYDAQRLVFAICDGVSQSFMGDLAAASLGDALRNWLWARSLLPFDPPLVAHVLGYRLQQWTNLATSMVEQTPIPEHLPRMLRRVLETKRREAGSQTMFVAGVVDRARASILICWVGDSKFQLVTRAACLSADTVFHTHERWSTNRGLIGIDLPHVAVFPLTHDSLLTVYTDGIERYEAQFQRALTATQLADMAHAMRDDPRNDDIALLQLRIPAPIPDP